MESLQAAEIFGATTINTLLSASLIFFFATSTSKILLSLHFEMVFAVACYLQDFQLKIFNF
jgi:hypothetical protein